VTYMIELHPTPRDLGVSGWHKASYSAPEKACLEVSHSGAAVAVRDTKNRAAGSLAFPARAWARFLAEVTRS
jgi:uncharacterized protein DUF397